MTAIWFVKTRGRGISEDYTWRALGDEDPGIAAEVVEAGWRGRSCRTLVDDERPGLMLYEAADTGTVLYVTGLRPPGEPADVRKRPIRAAVLGIATTGAGQDDLVGMACAALLDELAPRLPVVYGHAEGFDVPQEEWVTLVDEVRQRSLDLDFPGQLSLRPTQHPDTPGGLERAASQLAAIHHRHHALARLSKQIIVLRTGTLGYPELAKLKPWRTISDAPQTETANPRAGFQPAEALYRLLRNGPSVFFVIAGLVAVVFLTVLAVRSAPQSGVPPPATSSSPHPTLLSPAKPPTKTPTWTPTRTATKTPTKAKTPTKTPTGT
ncbi:hypothetical protein [Nonomuraea jiangxiensis]|uniref:Uncharacterized protein n=1 Tax=Nonomuraea jiangxiensis TaxID=633440 RepID=A0A1G9P5Y6_9ACTN|nr:hypothetical protein [Nonomuraea jiangxiensis]SDL94114.1 hypothetical protein SAMN05421869_13343 [Nonomuraea jiangxiensis]